MNALDTQMTVEKYLNTILENSGDVFLVDLKISPGNNIKIFLDADSGISIDKCVRVNRALYKLLEENELFSDNNFSLEVSSPGIDEPLKLKRQYTKNIGRTVEVLLADDSKKEGKLICATDEDIVIEEMDGKGKKAIVKQTTILYNQIKHIKVLVTF